MTSDDTDAGGSGRMDTDDDPLRAPEVTASPKWGLPARLSQTVPDRRAYGLERIEPDDPVGLLSPRERQYVRHADRLDPPNRSAVEDVLVERVDEFVDADWPVIQESYPEVAAALRDTICGDETD